MTIAEEISIFEVFLKDHVMNDVMSNDAENTALPSQELITFLNILKQKSIILHCYKVLQYSCFYCIFFIK